MIERFGEKRLIYSDSDEGDRESICAFSCYLCSLIEVELLLFVMF